MKENPKKNPRVCRSEKDFEDMFLPELHRKKKQRKAMETPEQFGEHLKGELVRCIRGVCKKT